MKTITLLLFLCFVTKAEAKNYYFSSSTGNDNRTAIEAQNSSTPWKTLTKANETTFAPGDSILFKRGDTFYGFINPHQYSSFGTAANRLTYGAYGTGAKPIISGFTTVTAWTNLGGNIWESTSAVSTLAQVCNMVLINGVNTPKGRFPNTGYMPIQSHVGTSRITNSALNSATIDWTGADVVIKTSHFTLDVAGVGSHSGSTLNISGPLSEDPPNGYGFFIQNDPKTLNTQNEWYYNPSTFRLRIYSTSQPTNVKIATLSNLCLLSACPKTLQKQVFCYRVLNNGIFLVSSFSS